MIAYRPNYYLCGKYSILKQELVNIGIQEFLKLSFLVDESNIGQDFIIGEANGSAAFRDSRLLEALHYPVRYDGYMENSQ